MTVQLHRHQLEEAARQGLIDPGKVGPLWDFLQAGAQDVPAFRATHILYYLGGCIAIGAMTLFMTLGVELFGGWGLFGIAVAYALAGLWLTERFLWKKRLPIPAGITSAFVIALTPMAVYGLQQALGLWPAGEVLQDFHTHVDWRWLLMEIATLVTGTVLLWRYRQPFAVLPVAVTLWYLTMDLTPFLFGDEDRSWELRKFVSLWVGVLITGLAFWVDLRTRRVRDYGFWLYLFGVLSFWCGLTFMKSDSELAKLGYLGINLLMLAIGAVLSRRVFAVFGSFGVVAYVGHLAYETFRDSLVFPFVLTLVGAAVVGLGLLWQRHEERLALRWRRHLPAPLRELLEQAH